MVTLETEWMEASHENFHPHTYTLCCTRQQYRQLKKDGGLPKNTPCRFAQWVFSIEDREVVGKRVVKKGSDPYKESGVELLSPATLPPLAESMQLSSTYSTTSQSQADEDERSVTSRSITSMFEEISNLGGDTLRLSSRGNVTSRVSLAGSEGSFVDDEGSGISLPSGLW